MMPRGSSSPRLERNVKERHRRMQMKHLYITLASSIQIQPSTEKLRLPGLLDRSTEYINQLSKTVEELKERAEVLRGEGCSTFLPVLKVKDMGNSLELNLIIGTNKSLLLSHVLSVLDEEGAQVVSVSYSVMGDRIFYTVSAKPLYSRIGIQTSSVRERLTKLIF